VLFAPIQVLTTGGPEGSSNLLMYDSGFLRNLLNSIVVAPATVVGAGLILLLLPWPGPTG
jgi:hypothetical protein